MCRRVSELIQASDRFRIPSHGYLDYRRGRLLHHGCRVLQYQQCKECGKPIAPGSVDGVCTVCRIKARTKKRQEEAAAKAKQLREEREAKKAAEEAAKAAAEAGADAAETAVQTAAAPAETAAAGSVITALTPEKAAPAALDETPAAAPENTAEKDVPDTPKND